MRQNNKGTLSATWRTSDRETQKCEVMTKRQTILIWCNVTLPVLLLTLILACCFMLILIASVVSYCFIGALLYPLPILNVQFSFVYFINFLIVQIYWYSAVTQIQESFLRYRRNINCICIYLILLSTLASY